MNDMVPPRRRLPPPRPRKAAVAIAQAIVDEITNRGHTPGTRLATEKEMLARYDVGRGTLREALRFLELSGVIQLRAGPQGGPIVMTPDAHNFAGMLGLFLQVHPTPFRSIVEAREALEPMIAQMAAANASPSDLQQMESSIDSMEAFLDDEEAFLVENERFHEAVATAAGNVLFSLLISSLHLITDGMPVGVSYPHVRRLAVVRAHRSIFEAIRSGDAPAAEAAMRRHMKEFARYVEQNFSTVFDRVLRWSDIAP